uniref:NADH-ubiquinone oxidoreductase chain 6 n=1 Tax=Paratimomenus flavocapitatus TaxID=2021295 RepID=A0A678RW97_9NEOP|nr:NADH dehydrogenase subunit 6 [Paratimomenus flavocapitatus]
MKTLLILFSASVMSLFIHSSHPLALGVNLMLQTLLVALLIGFIVQTFWLSYALFLVVLGGMLVLFLYVTSLVSNELFDFKITFLFKILWNLGVILILLFIWKGWELAYNPNFMSVKDTFHPYKNFVPSLQSFYSPPTLGITLFLVIYLLIALLIIGKIININAGPLRTSF